MMPVRVTQYARREAPATPPPRPSLHLIAASTFATASSDSTSRVLKTGESTMASSTCMWQINPSLGGTFTNVSIADTAPSIVGPQPLAIVNAMLKDEWIKVDLTDLVDGDGTVSLRITSDSPGNSMYSLKENHNMNSPELIVLQAPDSNFGTDKQLKADANNDGMHNFRLHFGATDIPQGEVKSAVLHVYIKNEGPAFGRTFVEATNSQWG